MQFKINLNEPLIDNSEMIAVNKTIKSDWISSSGSNIKVFEQKITKAKYVLSCVNGSCAFLMSVKLLSKNMRGDFIIPTLSYIS